MRYKVVLGSVSITSSGPYVSIKEVVLETENNNEALDEFQKLNQKFPGAVAILEDDILVKGMIL